MSVPDPALTDWVPIYAGSPAFTYRGDYVPATQYNDGDIVMYNGTPWLAVKNNNTPPDPFPLPAGGAQLAYEGAYVPATSYDDGDVVVLNGVAFLCVGGPTTVTPDPSVWGAAYLSKAAYGTSLPASPVDGQEAILVDSLTAPTYQWRFRYNAGSSSAYKWEFVGGSPKLINPASGWLTTTSASFVTLSQSPSFTLPRDGDYQVDWGSAIYNGAAGQGGAVGVKVGAATNSDAEALMGFSAVANQQGNWQRTRRLTAQPAATVLAMEYHIVGGTTAGFMQRFMKITPERVS